MTRQNEIYTVFGQSTVFQHWWTRRGLTEILRFERAETWRIRQRLKEYRQQNGLPPRLYDAECAGTSKIINPDEASI